MPNTETLSEDEPGHRNGEGSSSILPHLQRQTQTQLREPLKRLKQDDDGGQDSEQSGNDG